MTSYVALLRAINVGGRNPVPMASLRAMCAELGLHDARTLLQSGNLVFRTEVPRARLVALFEAGIASRFGADVRTIVRSGEEWHAMIAANPFPQEASNDPSHLLVMCCTGAPGAEALASLRAWITGREVVRAVGADLFITYPDGIGDSKLTTAVIERRLAVSGTARNWNTVTKLAALAAG
jgi:uncharacterized protein (DUF1697 family)